MRELILDYARYNTWANKKILDTISQLTHEQHHAMIVSSFTSLYETVYHILASEDVWLQRVDKRAYTELPDNFEGSMKSVLEALNLRDQQWESWLELRKEEDLSEMLSYVNMKGIPFRLRLDKILLHVFNHSTYHRGQLVTMLRQHGVTQIPVTDFTFWAAGMR
jgi:uncharacterized damage-inducible protein DinB